MDDNKTNQNNPNITVPPVEPAQPIEPIPESQTSPIQPQPAQPTPLSNQEHDTGTKTIVTVLVLLFAYPIGILLMWAWTRWPKWVKFLVTLPIILVLVGIALTFFVATKDPFKNLSAAQDRNYELTTQEFSRALQAYYNLHQSLPWTGNSRCSSKPTGNETITNLKPCVSLIINDGILKEAFMASSYVNNIYVSDNSIPGTIRTSVCFLPAVKTTTAKYTKDGQACSSSTGCYSCSLSEFTEIVPTANPLAPPTDFIQSSTPTPPASTSGNTLLK